MKYVACLRVGQNDIKALANLEEERRVDIAPLLEMRGKDDKHLKAFFKAWQQHNFFLDVSRVPSDIKEAYIQENDLLNHANGFSKKESFFDDSHVLASGLIPVVSWVDTDPQRDIVQSALRLSAKYQTIAIRPRLSSDITPATNSRLFAILDAVPSPENIVVILDFLTTPPTDMSAGSPTHKTLSRLDQYGLQSICLLSTTFPADKPTSNTSRTVLCSDPTWQSAAMALGLKTTIVEGDYGATNPASPMEYVNGMPVIPFANYYTPPEWWQRRKGGDKEYSNYIAIAQEITRLPGFNEAHCWGTREIAKISRLPPNADGGYGNNGHWNGIKSNQHICVTIDRIRADEDVDYDDLI
ncbi:beta family protein [Pseudomonas sp. EpS/L25]|uniref:beta family protein n=1 Tax=Pseudomonas sp. EpS/L25 TaxID=1749078 RepID=UPI0009E923A4|nr:hypothetical protein [Pseudomonas sp. EpS/L25]